MATVVRVQNFQSVEDATVELDGLTVITGPNNSGKTVIMRAITGVFTNTRGTHFVRHDAKHCTVTITFDDGNTVIWEKGEGINRYHVNGKLLERVGHGCPPEVEAMGIRPVTAGNETYWPQIGKQVLGQVFLLDKPGSQIAEVVADVKRVGACNNALRAVEKDRRSTSAALKIRKQDLTKASEMVGKFEGLDGTIADVAACESAHTEALALHAKCTATQALHQRHGAAVAVQRHYAGVATITTPPRSVVDAAEKVGRAVVKVHGLADTRRGLVATVAKLAGVASITPPDSAQAVRLGEAMGMAKGLAARHGAAVATVAALRGVGAVVVPSALTEATTAKVAANNAAKLLTSRGKWRGALGERTVRLERADSAIADAKAEITSLLAELGQCPTCGSDCHAGTEDHG